MESVTRSIKSRQAGQALIYVAIAVALVGVVIAPMLRFVYTGHQAVQEREQRMLELYSADAGIEDAMYQIKHNLPGVGDLSYGDSYDPETPDGWNDRDMDVTVEKVWIPDEICAGCDDCEGCEDVETPEPTEGTDYSDTIVMAGLYQSVMLAAASDDFEELGWTGGAGWAGDWVASGSAAKGSDGDCISGSRYLSIAGTDGSAQRETDMVGFYAPQLQFYAKASSLEEGDTAECSLSTNGSDWTSVVTWDDGNNTDTYQYYDLDISEYGNATELWLRFSADLTGGTIASDGFESGGWTGGTGWANDWLHSGYSSVTSYGGPHSGSRHAMLQSGSGYIARAVDLSEYEAPKLKFWWKESSWEYGDKAYFKISPDGVNWTTIRTYVTLSYGYQNTYFEEEIDLSPYAEGSSQFWIAFDAAMSRSSDYFYIDDVWIGDSDTFYVDDVWMGQDVDSYTIEIAYTDSIGPVYLDALSVWLPPGALYGGVSDSLGLLTVEPTYTITSFAGGTVVSWEFDPRIDLSQPVGGGGAELPIVRSLTFTFQGAGDNQGMFAWLDAYVAASGGSTPDFISWDTGYELYRATSSASNEIWGTNTMVEAYVGQGEVEKRGVASYGDYRAVGAPLLIDYAGDSYVKEYRVEPDDPDTWVTKDGFYYTGRAEVNDIAAGSEVVAAWLYWAGFIKTSSWSAPDTVVDFMYPADMGIEAMGNASAGGGNDVFYVDYYPIVTLPETETVWLDDGESQVELQQGSDYTLDRDDGVLTINNDELEGEVSMHYWAEHWETIEHAAYNRYGMSLPPAETEISVGHSYACFADVTDLIPPEASGEYAVRGVTATAGVDGQDYGQKCYSGWSLVVIYQNLEETAHQFYLYDPIHNAEDCPYHFEPYSSGEFTLEDFYPPEGLAEGRLTCFVGEGDSNYAGDYVRFKGASQTVYNPLSGDNNPYNNVMNTVCTSGARGIDIDTYDITSDIGSDTEANLQFETSGDRWYLIYTILSFKTAMAPKEDYAFNVAAMTYSYHVGPSSQ